MAVSRRLSPFITSSVSVRMDPNGERLQEWIFFQRVTVDSQGAQVRHPPRGLEVAEEFVGHLFDGKVFP